LNHIYLDIFSWKKKKKAEEARRGVCWSGLRRRWWCSISNHRINKISEAWKEMKH